MNPPAPDPDYESYVLVTIFYSVIYVVARGWLSKVHVPESRRATIRWFATMGTGMAILICGSNMHQYRSMHWWEKGAAIYLIYSLAEVLVDHWSKKVPGKPPEVVEGPGNRPPGPTPG